MGFGVGGSSGRNLHVPVVTAHCVPASMPGEKEQPLLMSAHVVLASTAGQYLQFPVIDLHVSLFGVSSHRALFSSKPEQLGSMASFNAHGFPSLSFPQVASIASLSLQGLPRTSTPAQLAGREPSAALSGTRLGSILGVVDFLGVDALVEFGFDVLVEGTTILVSVEKIPLVLR